MNQNRQRRGGVFKIYDIRSRPKGEGGGVFKIYDQPESPHDGRV